MASYTHNEDIVYRAVRDGELQIDGMGRVWRLAKRQADRWRGGVRVVAIKPVRAERLKKRGYLSIAVMWDGMEFRCMAHRLVWVHFNGPIPGDLTINHRNGKKTENWLRNLELATLSEQQAHLRDVLGIRCGPKRIGFAEAEVIRARRARGETLISIGADYGGMATSHVSRIARGQAWGSTPRTDR